MGRPLIIDESIARMRNEGLGIRNEGGGFAANIYGAMPESSIQVTSPKSLATHPLLSYFRVQVAASPLSINSPFPSRGKVPLKGRIGAQAV